MTLQKFAAGLSNRPRMAITEREELLVYVMRVPEVYTEARRMLLPEHFDSEMEAGYHLLLRIYYELADRMKYKPAEVTYMALHAALDEAVKGSRALAETDVGRHLLLRPEEVDPDDPNEDVGLVWRAYHRSNPGQLDVTYGMDLLRRFLRERRVIDRTRMIMTMAGESNPEGFEQVLREVLLESEQIGSIGGLPVGSLAMGELWGPHESRIEGIRGRPLVGLRTGLDELDARTLGLRGLTVLGSRPGVGKTALAIAAALGVCRHHAENDAVVLFLSLEMDADAILSRIKTHLARMDWQVYVGGSHDGPGRDDVGSFDAADAALLRDGEDDMKEQQVDRRFFLVDRDGLGPTWTAETVIAMLKQCKAEAGAGRALVVIDHLQYIPVPPAEASQGRRAGAAARRGELEEDKLRVRLAGQVVRATRTEANPLGDAVLLLSQSRKPPTAKEPWGQSSSELLGSVETPCLADAILMLHRADEADLRQAYGIPKGKGDEKDKVAEFGRYMANDGVSLVVADLDKGRDGMTLSKWGLEFLFRRSRFRPPLRYRYDEFNAVRKEASGSSGGAAADQFPPNPVAKPTRQKVLEALGGFPAGETVTAIAAAASVSHEAAKKALVGMVAEGLVVEVEVTKPHGKDGKGSKPHPGFRLA